MVGTNLAGRFNAILAGHHVVHENQVKDRLPTRGHGLGTTVGAVNFGLKGFQHFGADQQVQIVVIDDQEFGIFNDDVFCRPGRKVRGFRIAAALVQEISEILD